MYKHLLNILCILFAASSLMAQQSLAQLSAKSHLPVIVNDSSMFIGSHVDSLTEQERYFNPIYLVVQKGKEYLKKQLIQASVCDCDTTIPNRAIGIFSVGENKNVTFSQGNLQYFPAANLWKFADTQYETLGNSNKYISPTYRNWVDLFGWSADNTTAPFGISNSSDNTDYSGAFVDWGTNWICGDKPGTWRTLSEEEWNYLFYKRQNADKLYGVAQVAGVNGIIILPDNWVVSPTGIYFKEGLYNTKVDNYAIIQSFTEQQWAIMEQAGAVFLPAAGYRDGERLVNYQLSGYYWSSTEVSNKEAHRTSFYSYYLSTKEINVKSRGRSVRLVADIFMDCDTVEKNLRFAFSDTIMYIGETLSLSIIPDYCIINGNISWSCSDYTLAQLQNTSKESCLIHAQQAGVLQLIITADQYPDLTDTCTIHIRDKYISGIFSISTEKKVVFSPGNLQYLPITQHWKFANTQYRTYQSTITDSQSSLWADLFYWNDGTDFVDWGTNTISGDKPDTWRTLSKDEWDFLLNKRDNAKKLRSFAQIAGTNGLIFLPDNWICPEGIKFQANQFHFNKQSFSEEQWTIMEQAGAVFLPAAGRAKDNQLFYPNKRGNYWSSTRRNANYADYLVLMEGDGDVYVDALLDITYARSVRLVHDTIVPEYVDLGLSVKWATFNLGAKSPEEAGEYFAWGETTSKEAYTYDNYKWCNGTTVKGPFNKYCTNSNYGPTDNISTLEVKDDVAAVRWKGEWHIPTYADYKELIDKCTWQLTNLNGQKGFRVTSTVKGYEDKSIFLPMVGYYTGKTHGTAHGRYWANMVYIREPNYAYEMICNAGYEKGYFNCLSRTNGLSIRPVYGKSTTQKPSITTMAATQITDNSAFVGGMVTNDGGAAITEWGIVYSTSSNPTIAHNKIVNTNDIGLFFNTIDNLRNNTKYYARAYAINEKGVAYGSQTIFTTGCFNPVEVSGTENGYNYVDLELPSGNLWATHNIGAKSPEEYGDYFAWGETEPKTTYTWGTYTWSKNGSSNKFSKYSTRDDYGPIDNKTNLEQEDDAATVKWGGQWHIPTYPDFYELKSNCVCNWATENGVKGYRITSKKNGNSIFLPAAGYITGEEVTTDELYCHYHSSSLYGYYTYASYGCVATPSSFSFTTQQRYVGYPIRPIFGPGVKGTPEVNTNDIKKVEENSAIINGWLRRDGGSPIIEYGFVYSTQTNPTISDSKVTSNAGLGNFTCTITGLSTETTYYVRTFATNATGNTGYGTALSFKTISPTTSDPSGLCNGYGYVDLGLSVKWATHNIGATNPEDYGDYYAWGETTTKNAFSWENYAWYNATDTTITKYCVSYKYGEVDEKIILEPEDDAAHTHWKDQWRMPTNEEWNELRTECEWHWTTINNINGYKIVGKNGNSIFLPSAGYQLNGKTIDKASVGYYQSSSLYLNQSQYAYGINFSTKYIDIYYNGRYCGQSIRPVCE